jgi:hypothetical protein
METVAISKQNDIIPRNNVLEMARYLPEMREMAQIFVKASIVNKQLDTLEKVLAVMLKAHELGVSQTYALEKMSVINGSIMMESELMLALIYKSGLCASLDIRETASSCTVTMVRSAPKIRHSATFSLDDAKRAGLNAKENWAKYPKAMLRWRSIADCAKIVFPDVLGGLLDNVPLLVRLPQMEQEAQEAAALTPELTAGTPAAEEPPPTAEPAEPKRPMKPAELKNRILAYAARAGNIGDAQQKRNWTRNSLRLLTVQDAEVGTLLRYLFGKSAVDDLSIAECKALAKWLNVSKNGDELLADPHSVLEFYLIMRERGASTRGVAEQLIFNGEQTSKSRNYNAIAE